jgi:hypothetical protein
MKRVVGLSKITILILSFIALLSCKDKPEYDFDAYNEMFVDSFSNEDDYTNKNITELTAYYNDTWYFYEVKYHNDKYNEDYHMLYIFRYGDLSTYFTLANTDDCYEYFPTYYTKYLDAKENGVKLEFSNTEINELITNFYS